MKNPFKLLWFLIPVLSVLTLYGCSSQNIGQDIDNVYTTDTEITSDVLNEESSESESIGECNHNWIELKRNKATCTKSGAVVYRCDICNDEKTEVLDKEPHTEMKIEGLEPTCDKSGYGESLRCSVCGYIITAAQYIAPTDEHNEVYIAAREQTCTKNGYTEGTKCSTCGKYIQEPKIILASHDWEIVPRIEHTCIEVGYEENKKCTRCGIFESELVEIPASHTNVQILYGYKASCTAPGLTDGKYCSDCNEILIDREIIAPLGHNYVPFDHNISDCNSNGLKNGGKCIYCGDINSAPEISYATGHSFDDEKCINCGLEFTKGLKFSLNTYGDSEAPTYLVAGFEEGYSDDVDIIVIPNVTPDGYNVVGILKDAFRGNKAVERIVMSSNIVIVEPDAFDGCTNLEIIECGDLSQTDLWASGWQGDCSPKIKSALYQDKNYYDIYIDAMLNFAYNRSKSAVEIESYKYYGRSMEVIYYDHTLWMQNGKEHYFNSKITDYTQGTANTQKTEYWYIDGYIYAPSFYDDLMGLKIQACYETYLAVAGMPKLPEPSYLTVSCAEFYKDINGNMFLDVAVDISVLAEIQVNIPDKNIKYIKYIYEFDNSGDIVSIKCISEFSKDSQESADETSDDVDYILETNFRLSEIGVLDEIIPIPENIQWTDYIQDNCLEIGRDHVEIICPKIISSCFNMGIKEGSYCSTCFAVIKEISDADFAHEYVGEICIGCGKKERSD